MRAPKKCGNPTCDTRVTGRAYCPAHTRLFDTSKRRSRLPSDWPGIRSAVRRRAQGRCQATTHHPACDGVGTDCDHIRSGDDHSMTNLQWLSRPCHDAKTRRETAARNRSRRVE